MKNNSRNFKFEFYNNLNTLLRDPVFDDRLAEEIIRLARRLAMTRVVPGIVRLCNDRPSLNGFTVEILEDWHKSIVHPPRSGPDKGIELAKSIVEAAFEDLAEQMRSEVVRDLHRVLKKLAGIENNLFIHVRHSKDLGDGVAAMTIVTDDVTFFKELLKDYVLAHGRVHYSESALAADPA